MDADGARDGARRKRTVKSCGPDAPMLASSRAKAHALRDDGDNEPGPTGLKTNLNPLVTVAKGIRRREEHEVSRKAIAQGK